MKKVLSTYLLALCGILCIGNLYGQVTVNYPVVGSSTFTIAPPATCSFNFFDNGGAGGVYSNAVNPAVLANSVTFAPANNATHRIRATFSAFSTETNWDALYVWDGPSMASPLINSGNPAGFTPMAGGWWGATAPNNAGANVVQATVLNTSGALTFSDRKSVV